MRYIIQTGFKRDTQAKTDYMTIDPRTVQSRGKGKKKRNKQKKKRGGRSQCPVPTSIFLVWELNIQAMSAAVLQSSGFLSGTKRINLGSLTEMPRDGWTKPTAAWWTGEIVKSAK